MEMCKSLKTNDIKFLPLYHYVKKYLEEDIKQKHESSVSTQLYNVDALLGGGFSSGIHSLFSLHRRCASDFVQQLLEAFTQQKYAVVYVTDYHYSFDVCNTLLSRMLYKHYPQIANKVPLNHVIHEHPKVYSDIRERVESITKYISVVQSSLIDVSSFREALVKQQQKYEKLVVIFNHSDFCSIRLSDEKMFKKYRELAEIANDLKISILVTFILTVADYQKLTSGQSDITEFMLQSKTSILLQPQQKGKETNSFYLLHPVYSYLDSLLIDVWIRPSWELNFTCKTNLLYFPYYVYFQEA